MGDANQGYRNMLVAVHLVLILAVVGITASRNKGLEKSYQADWDSFRRVSQLGPSNEESGKILADLVQKYPASHMLVYNYGLHFGTTGKYADAVTYYKKALELNPYLAENGRFLFEYGLWLYDNQEYDRAKALLTRSVELGVEQNVKEQAEKILAEITKRGQ